MPNATKAELRREISELREVGRQMANLCFNIGQHHQFQDNYTVDRVNLQIMHLLSRQWDAITRAEGK